MPSGATRVTAERGTDKRLVIIEDPILNGPFGEPLRHFKFTEEGITNEVIEKRRTSAYFIPVPRPRSRRSREQLVLDTEWTADRLKENDFINKVRTRIGQWRASGYAGSPITNTTRQLLEQWKRADRERRLFFCQIEAVETAIYLTEVAPKWDAWIDNDLRAANTAANPELFRIAFKMATGSGKTVVMAMLIAWQALNKFADPQNAKFSDTFLIVTPGITIRDRLRVLLPNDTENYYRALDLVSADQLVQLEAAKIVITNFHAFRQRELVEASKLTKSILKRGGNGGGLFTETPEQMVRRVCRELGNKKNIIVLNDEAHHCYRRKPDGEDEELSGDDKREAQQREEEARVWISGLEAVKRKIGVRAIYDLSATPFFLRGSGYPEGTLFSWVVSDFSLIDAIESGIVKVPRVPVTDDQMRGEQPTYRDLWLRIRAELPKKGRKTDAIVGEPKLPAVLEGAIESLYENYKKSYQQWEQSAAAKAGDSTPPVFIVVANNTNVSKLIFDHIAGWEKPLKDGSTVPVPGKLELFSNVQDGRWLARPNTVLIDSQQLESGEAMSDDFKKIAAREIDEFKVEYRLRFPGRDVEQLTDEDLLREVMNTVGKHGKLGEQIKCVVSVSMLTEGWDANTVNHSILNHPTTEIMAQKKKNTQGEALSGLLADGDLCAIRARIEADFARKVELKIETFVHPIVEGLAQGRLAEPVQLGTSQLERLAAEEEIHAESWLDPIPVALRDMAVECLNHGDVDGFLGKASNECSLELVFYNTRLLWKLGLYEPALLAAFDATRKNNSCYRLRELRGLFEQADPARLRTLGDPLPSPGPFTLYRGVAGRGSRRMVAGLSWTSSLGCACWFARRHYPYLTDPAVYTITITDDLISAHLNRRNEGEFIVLDPPRPRRMLLTLEDILQRADDWKKASNQRAAER